ncbi:hypothetical protein PHJA_002664800 [Phtheirospermum japonicum]|uniref:PB1 domain-containing protein n=1 Tax=Phtheirospermum japonicum TaxID=374723 RepID=A0A830D0R0_9LAMI|nr:hypothetical protein PHJA_002664800 [Phtheirospermum japonicum]
MKTIKFLYNYGGKIVPRPINGKLRYVGGHTRVLFVDRSITYSELMVKFGELCGSSMNLKRKLPSDDLDLLIMIKSDEELRAVIKDYESASSPVVTIRAVLYPVRSAKKVSDPSSPTLRYPVLTGKSSYCQDRSPMHFYHVPHWNYSH